MVDESQPVKAPRAYRVRDRALIAGVAAGLGAHSRFSTWAIRLAFVLTSAWKFSGAIAYVVLWLLLPLDEPAEPIGLVAAQRQGLRGAVRRTRWPQIVGWAGALIGGVAIGLLIRTYDSSLVGQYAAPAFVMGWGIGLVWFTREARWPRWGKTVVALAGVLVAWTAGALIQASLLATLPPQLSDMAQDAQRLVVVLFVTGTTMVGCIVVGLPWLIHPARSEEDKQAELIAETKADMAAHLHDSVLQTLAVIQKQSGDAKLVAQLARRQERELREWLYGEHMDDESARTALKDVVTEVEATYPVAIELVMVKDHEMTVGIDAVVRAAREAIFNAAKHSGADKIDVYAEIGATTADVYVRDRGKGFEMDDIGEDRMGIRRSIIARMTRFGGNVDIRSTPGEGTEVHLSMPLNQEGTSHD